MSNAVTVRNAVPTDAPVISALMTTLASGLGDPTTIASEYAAEALRTGSCHVLLAVRRGAALGMLSYYFHPSLYHAAESCLIEELVVAPPARSQGVGAALLEEAIRRARERGCAEVALSVMNSNRDAQRFYERHGFVADAVYMERHFAVD